MAASMVMLEEIMGPRRFDDDSNGHDRDDDSRDLAMRAIAATVDLAKEVGRLAGAITTMEEKLNREYKTADKQELDNLRSKDKWFKRVVSAVVTAVAVAETLHWIGLSAHH